MGSSLSGRRDGKPLVEDCLTIDLAALMRLAPICEGRAGNGQLNWSIDGEPIASVPYRLDLHDRQNARLILNLYVPQPAGDRKLKTQTIALTATNQNFGGKRWWLRCPLTGKRVRMLHLPPDRDRFASREAWGLAYRVERLNHFDRPFEKLFRVQRKLGGVQGLAAEIQRPKGMWRRTYARHLACLERHDAACLEQITALIEKS